MGKIILTGIIAAAITLIIGGNAYDRMARIFEVDNLWVIIVFYLLLHMVFWGSIFTVTHWRTFGKFILIVIVGIWLTLGLLFRIKKNKKTKESTKHEYVEKRPLA